MGRGWGPVALAALVALALGGGSADPDALPDARRTRGDIRFEAENNRHWRSSSSSSSPPSPFILFGPHGYSTFPHSRCQEVPTADVSLADIEGDWNLVEYMASFDGKPFPPHSPYLCPESKVVFGPARATTKTRFNVSQVSFEWPLFFKDVVEWEQHPEKTGVFFHEENIFALWTMKVMEVRPDDHMLFFFCIDYTVWPGWNHRGVFILSRQPTLASRIKRRLSPAAHRRLRITYHRTVNTTTCDRDAFLTAARERWHPHRGISRDALRAPIHPWVSRGHRRNLDGLE